MSESFTLQTETTKKGKTTLRGTATEYQVFSYEIASGASDMDVQDFELFAKAKFVVVLGGTGISVKFGANGTVFAANPVFACSISDAVGMTVPASHLQVSNSGAQAKVITVIAGL